MLKITKSGRDWAPLTPAKVSGKTNNCCIGCPSFNVVLVVKITIKRRQAQTKGD